MPFCAARARRGSASLNASAAAFGSLEAIASSTLRTKVRISVRRDLLTAVRRMVWRAAFWADFVLAMELDFLNRRRPRACDAPPKTNGAGFSPSREGGLIGFPSRSRQPPNAYFEAQSIKPPGAAMSR